jgi:hypothetical protein
MLQSKEDAVNPESEKKWRFGGWDLCSPGWAKL